MPMAESMADGEPGTSCMVSGCRFLSWPMRKRSICFAERVRRSVLPVFLLMGIKLHPCLWCWQRWQGWTGLGSQIAPTLTHLSHWKSILLSCGMNTQEVRHAPQTCKARHQSRDQKTRHPSRFLRAAAARARRGVFSLCAVAEKIPFACADVLLRQHSCARYEAGDARLACEKVRK
jgi:hypothetical protein